MRKAARGGAAATGLALALFTLSALLLALPTARAAMAGPDAGGYYYIDTFSGGPVPSMADLNVSTVIPVTDESALGYVPLPAGFLFDFYGTTVNGVAVSDNGYLSFSNTTNAYIDTSIPASAAPNNMVAGFWDDLDPRPATNAGVVRYKTLGSAPTRTFVVEWAMVRHYATAAIEGGMLKDPSPDAFLCHTDTDGGPSVAVDAFYLSPDGNDTTVEVGDIRLVQVSTYAAGTLVTLASSDFANPVACRPYAVAYNDQDSDGQYSDGDYVYIGSNANTNSTVQPSSEAGEWWIRATAAGSLQPGTVVLTGHIDITRYGDGMILPGAEFAWDDVDVDGVLTSADSAYITSRAIVGGDYVPDASVRIRHATLAFGSVVDVLDPDLVNMQIKLFENGDDIEVHYASAESDGGPYTIGIEDATGTVGLQYAQGNTDIANRAVRFTKTGPLQTTISPEPSSAWQPAGQSTTYLLHCTQTIPSALSCSGATMRVYYDGVQIASGIVDAAGQFTFTHTPATDGTHTLAWNATKTGFPPEFQKTRTLRIDSVAPSAWANATCSVAWCNANVLLTGAGSDATSGVASLVCQLDGVVSSCAGTTAASEGAHRWYVNATDASGKLWTVARSFGIDKTPPSLSLTSGCAAATSWCNANVLFTLTHSDALSGEAGSTKCTDNNVSLVCAGFTVSTDGGHFVQANVVDNAGNVANATLFRGRDVVPPSLSLSSDCSTGSLWCAGSFAFALAHSDALSGEDGATRCTDNNATISCAGFNVIADGGHFVQADIVDKAGNVANQTIFRGRDTAPPLLSLLSDCASLWCNTDVLVTLTHSDPLSGEASTTRCTDNNVTIGCAGFPVTSDGAHFVQANIVDRAGNVRNMTLFAGRDTAPPSLTLASGCSTASLWCAANVAFTLAHADALSGESAATRCTDNNATIACADFAVSADGGHFVQANVVDKAGNVANQTLFRGRDTVAPALTLTTDCGSASLWCSANVAVSLSHSDATSGEAATTRCTDNNATIGCASFSISSDGGHFVQANIVDLAGNAANATLFRGRDVTPPTTPFAITCDNAGNASWCKGTIGVAFTVSDATSGVASSACTVDNATVLCTSSSFSTDGRRYVQANVVDKAGNVANRTQLTLRDATPPTASFSPSCGLPGTPGWCRFASYTYTAPASDGLSGLVAGEPHCYLDGAAAACSGTVATQGAHALLLTVADLAGNTASSTTSLGVDSVAPSLWVNVTCSDERAAGWCRAASFSYQDAASDATSGIGSPVCTGGAGSACSGTPTTPALYALRVDGTDAAGNAAQLVRSYGLDPSRPALQATTPQEGGALTLAWSTPGSVATITGYALERALDEAATSWTTIYEGTATSVIERGLREDSSYTYRVHSVGDAGPSDMSALATARTLGLPSAPRELTASAQDVRVHLAWTVPATNGGSALTGYTIYRRSDSGVSGEDAIAVGPGQTTFDDTPPTNGRALGQLVYTIVARNAAGAGPRSNEATFQYASGQPPLQDPRQPVSSALPFQRDWQNATAPAQGTESARVVLTSPDGLTLYTVGTRTVAFDPDHVVVARDAVTGAPRWGSPALFDSGNAGQDRAFAATLSPDGSTIYVAGSANGAYGTIALRASDGTTIWTRVTPATGGNAIARAIQATATTVVVTGAIPGPGGTDALTMGLAASNGAVVWQARVATAFADDATALVLGGDVAYVGGTSQDDMFAIGYRAATGQLVWQLHRSGTDATERLAGLAVTAQRVVLAGTRIGSTSDVILSAYDLSGAQAWSATYDSTPLLDPTARADEAFAIANSTDGTRIYVAGRSTGPAENGRDALALAYDATTGARLWASLLDSGEGADDEALAVAVARDGLRVYVGGSAGGDLAVWALASTGGTRAWNDTLAHAGRDTARALAVATDGRVYAAGEVDGTSSAAIAVAAYGPAPLAPTGQAPPTAFALDVQEPSATMASPDAPVSLPVPRRT